MKNIKRMLVLLAAIVMAVCCVFAVACGDKEHECEHICTECGKCTSDCEEPECEDKCSGHNVVEHKCEHVCPTCNKCLDADCKDNVCKDKCPGHNVVEHKCEHV